MDLTPNAQELLVFMTPQGRVFERKVMPFEEVMNKILSILRRMPVVHELIS